MNTPATKNVKNLYLITALTNLWFITGSWLYFYRLYMSDRQIGLLDGLVFGIGLVVEIPSGALADLLGRKNQLRLGLLLMATGFLAQGFASEYAHILIGMLLFVVGTALVSGTDDALVYDSLDKEGAANKWKHIVARKYQIIHVVSIASFFIGGLLYIVHFRLPFILGGLGMLAAFFAAASLKEVPVKREKFSVKLYINQNLGGMSYLFKRAMLLYAFIALVVLGVGYAFEFGVIKPLILDKFGFTENAQAVINGIAAILTILAISKLTKLRNAFGEHAGLLALSFIMGAGFLAASMPIGTFGILAFLAIFIVNGLVEPWLNDIVQHTVPSSHRATALSTLASLQKFPYVLLAPLAGAASSHGSYSQFLAGVAICILSVTLLFFLAVFLRPSSREK